MQQLPTLMRVSTTLVKLTAPSMCHPLSLKNSLNLVMSDSPRSKPVTIQITLETPMEYWCQQLHCEKWQLVYALSQIGNSYQAVNYFLELNRFKTHSELD